MKLAAASRNSSECQQTSSVRKAALRVQQANLPGLAEGMAQLAFNEQQSCGRELGSGSFQIFYLALRFTRTKLTLNHSEHLPWLLSRGREAAAKA